MSWTLTAYLSSDSVTLSAAPYSIVSARGLGAPDVRRVTVQGPAQHGDSDKGYRTQPRKLELVIGITAATDALLDTYRGNLFAIFKPLAATPVKLRVTRDDGEVRQLDCYVDGDPQLDLLPAYRPGHYCRVTIPLYAPDAPWYRLAPGTASIVGPTSFASNWWLAGGAIGSAQVLMHGGTPATDEAWSYTGTIGTATSWELVVRATYVDPSGSVSYMFRDTNTPVLTPRFYRGTYTTGPDAGNPRFFFAQDQRAGAGMLAGTHNYFYQVRQPSVGIAWAYDWGAGGGQLASVNTVGSVNGANMRWRTSAWPGTVQYYALYSPFLTPSQESALNAYMAGTAGTVATSVAVAYAGDVDEYPVISVTGPISRPSVTNTATGEVLDFGTITIGAGTTYVIDTRYGYKTVLVGTADRKYQLTSDSDLGTWHIAPDPVAPGGTNLITLSGTAVGTATALSVVYYHRFGGW